MFGRQALKVSEERGRHRVFVAVEDPRLHGVLTARLRRAGYAPGDLTRDELSTMPPSFGPRQVVVIFLYAGPETAPIHQVAERLYREWSEQGFVLLVVFHPPGSTEQDIFRLWALDALWRYQSPQELVTINRSITEDRRKMVTELVEALPYFTGEARGQGLGASSETG